MDVVRATKREMEHPAGDRHVAELVDQDEAAKYAVRARILDFVRFEGDLPVGRNLGDADAVQFERFCGEMIE